MPGSAVALTSWIQAVDYRSKESLALYSPYELTSNENEKIVQASRKFGLDLAGWDFKVDEDGKLWTLEMNPMPGYAGYDQVLGGKISFAIITRLELASQRTRK